MGLAITVTNEQLQFNDSHDRVIEIVIVALER